MDSTATVSRCAHLLDPRGGRSADVFAYVATHDYSGRHDSQKETHTPPRQVRIGDEWYEFQAALEAMGGEIVGSGTERAENLRNYIAWFLRKQGSDEPRRPDADMMPAIRARGAQIKQEAEAKARAKAAGSRTT